MTTLGLRGLCLCCVLTNATSELAYCIHPGLMMQQAKQEWWLIIVESNHWQQLVQARSVQLSGMRQCAGDH